MDHGSRPKISEVPNLGIVHPYSPYSSVFPPKIARKLYFYLHSYLRMYLRRKVPSYLRTNEDTTQEVIPVRTSARPGQPRATYSDREEQSCKGCFPENNKRIPPQCDFRFRCLL